MKKVWKFWLCRFFFYDVNLSVLWSMWPKWSFQESFNFVFLTIFVKDVINPRVIGPLYDERAFKSIFLRLNRLKSIFEVTELSKLNYYWCLGWKIKIIDS